MEVTKHTRFLNVDLDLRSTKRLGPLLAGFGPRVSVLHERDDFVVLELAEQPDTAERAVLAFAALVDALPPDLRALWDGCERRRLDVGIQAGEAPHSITFELSPSALAAAVRIGAELAVTIYAPPREPTPGDRTRA